MTKRRESVPFAGQGEKAKTGEVLGRTSAPEPSPSSGQVPERARKPDRAEKRAANKERHAAEHARELEERRARRKEERVQARPSKLVDFEAQRRAERQGATSDPAARAQLQGELDRYSAPFLLTEERAELMVREGPEGALMELVKHVARLHDAALSHPEFSRDGAVTRIKWIVDVPAALACAREIRTMLGLQKVLEETRNAARQTPEQRAQAVLDDPVHGPLVRELIANEERG